MSISSESSASRAAEMSEEPAPVKGPPSNVVTGLIKAARPRQWVKNLLVLIAPVAALGSDVNYDWRDVAIKVSIAFVAFSSPRRRSTWSTTPVTSRRTAPSDETLPAHRGGCGARMACLLHSRGARRGGAWGVLPRDTEPRGRDRHLHRDAACVLLRPQAPGGAGHLHRLLGVPDQGDRWRRRGHIPLSQWFLLVMTFGSLFMVAGKRYAELQLSEKTGAKIRKSLESYTSTYLRFVWTLSATAMVVCYGLWAFERDGRERLLVCDHDDPVHDRDPALCRRRGRRPCGRTGRHRVEGSGTSVPGGRVDRNHRCRCSPRLTRKARRWAPGHGGRAGISLRRHRADQPVVQRRRRGRPVRLGSVAAPLDRRRRPHRAANGAKPAGGQRPRLQQGERVESNTSTLWTYLNYLGGLIGGPTQLEYVALWLALVLSVAGVVFLMLGAGRLYAPSLQGRRALLLPAGVLVYIAVPPARDFATSGLENGLVLAYLGLLWWMMVGWSQALRSHRDAGSQQCGQPVLRRVARLRAGLSCWFVPNWR